MHMGEQTTGTLWYRKAKPIGEGVFEVSSHFNDMHPDGAVVEGANEPSVANEVWRASSSGAGLLAISIDPDAIPGAPPVWFVFVPEPGASPAAVNLVAYVAHGHPGAPATTTSTPDAGTVISANRYPVLGVPNDSQVAAIRWYPHDGLIHQVYVRQDARRKSLGTLMIYAASAFHQAHAWPGRIHGDGRRTDLGDKFVAGLRHPQRYAPLIEVQPPMDEN
jgi:hypothetical protein